VSIFEKEQFDAVAMEEQLSRSRTRTVSQAQNPFIDPAMNKSLPALPPPPSEPDLSDFQEPKPGTPPLPSYLQFGHGSRPSRLSLQRGDKPSVKEMAATFERENSASDLGSRNPYRDQEEEPPVPTIPSVVEPESHANLAKERPAYRNEHLPTYQKLTGLESYDPNDSDTSVMSVYSADASVDPGADPGQYRHMQENVDLHSLNMSVETAAKSPSDAERTQQYLQKNLYAGDSHASISGGYFASAGVDVGTSAYGQEALLHSRDVYNQDAHPGQYAYNQGVSLLSEAAADPEALSGQAASDQNTSSAQHAYDPAAPLAIQDAYEQNAPLSAPHEHDGVQDAPKIPGFVPPTDEELADAEILSEDELPRPHSPFSVYNHQRQGIERKVYPFSALCRPQGPYLKNPQASNEDSDINLTKRSIITLVPPENARKHRPAAAEQENVFADASATSSQNDQLHSAVPAASNTTHATIAEEKELLSFSQVLIEHKERTRGATFSTVLSDQNPPPVPPRSKNRQRPLFKKRLTLPVNTRSVGRKLPGNPMPVSSQIRLAVTPEYLSAKTAESLLAAARGQMATPSIRRGYVQPSPTVLRLAVEIARSHGIEMHTGSRAVVRSVAFWSMVIVFQCSMISTVASVTVVVVRSQIAGTEGEEVGSGCMFWLVISIILFAVSGVAVLFVWARNMGYFSTFSKKLGMDEVGLLDRVLRQEEFGIRRSSTAVDIEANPASAYHRQPRAFESSATQASIVSSRAGSQWSSMYPESRSYAFYQETPCRPSGSRSENIMNNGLSQAGFGSSPITPVEAALMKEGVRFPFYASGPDQNLPLPPRNYLPATQNPPGHVQSRENTAIADIRVAARSPLEDLNNDLAIAHAAPEHLRHSVIQQHRAESKERSSLVRQSLESHPGKFRRAQTFDSTANGSFQNTIGEEDERNGATPMSQSAKYALQLELESIGKQLGAREGQLTRSPNIPNLAIQAFSPHQASDSGRGEPEYELNDMSIQPSTTYGSMQPIGGMTNGHIEAGSAGGMSRSWAILTSVRDHFSEQHGRSLGSAIRERHTKTKDRAPF
jgi:hypothetical protein